MPSALAFSCDNLKVPSRLLKTVTKLFSFAAGADRYVIGTDTVVGTSDVIVAVALVTEDAEGKAASKACCRISGWSLVI